MNYPGTGQNADNGKREIDMSQNRLWNACRRKKHSGSLDGFSQVFFLFPHVERTEALL